jgi:hypothetical protein
LKRAFLVLSILFVFGCSYHLSETELIYRYSDKYSIDSGIIYGIWTAETGRGTYNRYSNSKHVLIKQAWVTNYLHTETGKLLTSKYGDSLFYCVGPYQILVLTACNMGYRGTVANLATYETNLKYACRVINVIQGSYHASKNIFSAYNNGWAQLDHNGDYINQKYVDICWTAYTNFQPRSRK